jgi:peptidoglycan/LPS O-acetylase OafA/YrhL
LVVLGGHWLPILVTVGYIGVLIAVASVSYSLIEKPGQMLFARFARSGRARTKAIVIAPRLPA